MLGVAVHACKSRPLGDWVMRFVMSLRPRVGSGLHSRVSLQKHKSKIPLIMLQHYNKLVFISWHWFFWQQHAHFFFHNYIVVGGKVWTWVVLVCLFVFIFLNMFILTCLCTTMLGTYISCKKGIYVPYSRLIFTQKIYLKYSCGKLEKYSIKIKWIHICNCFQLLLPPTPGRDKSQIRCVRITD